MSIEAHLQAGAKIKHKHFAQGYEKVVLSNNTEIIVIYESAQLTPLTRHELKTSTVRVFFDYALPDSAIRATLDGLGLRNYIVGFGICDEN